MTFRPATERFSQSKSWRALITSDRPHPKLHAKTLCAGSLAGTLSPGFVPPRFRAAKPVTLVSTLCFALGCLILGTAPVWPAAVSGAVVEGAGWGGLVIAFNALFSAGFGGAVEAIRIRRRLQ